MSDPNFGREATQSALAADEMKLCSGCGKQLHKSARSCPDCGAIQRDVVGQKNKIVAALLAFFLGGFGVHKFYLGRIGWGIVYLLLFWTFIPTIVSLVEFVIYLVMSDEDFAKKYG